MNTKKLIFILGILGSLTVLGGDNSDIEGDAVSASTASTDGSYTSDLETELVDDPSIKSSEETLLLQIKEQAKYYAALYGQVAQLVAQIEEADDYLKPKSSKSSGYKKSPLSPKERNKWMRWRAQDLQELRSLEWSINQPFYTIHDSLIDCNDVYATAPSGKFYNHDHITYNRGIRFSFQLEGFVNSYVKTLERLQK